MKQFEYKVKTIIEKDHIENRSVDLASESTEMLNESGFSGWELVAVNRSTIWTHAFFYVFKKQIED